MRGLIMVSMLASAIIATNAGETLLNDVQLDALLTGNTAYITVAEGNAAAPNGGMAAFKFGADGASAAKLPTGTMLVGKWRLDDGKYCVYWDGGIQNSCTKIVKSADGIMLMDAATGEARGRIEKIVTGNPESL